jgi:hypothetical protein
MACVAAPAEAGMVLLATVIDTMVCVAAATCAWCVCYSINGMICMPAATKGMLRI